MLRITVDCLACGTCYEACPNGAIIEGENYQIDPLKCENCGTCLEACPAGAIVIE
ncbi:MAG: 4Fe-4S binding protein [Bacillota bacterium]